MASNEEKLLDYLKRVTADLRQTQRRLKDVESAGYEPVAIVGMSCRFPGGVWSPEELWELVAAERDAISELPTDRNWDVENLFHPDPEHPGTSYTREGGFIDDPAGFDAAFFGISPREALGMAPQQRLALEASWEAIEHAGVDPESLRGSRTGTFIGCDHLDYCSDASQVPEGSAGYFTIGNSASVVSGRVAYTLGLEGAAVTVDTACSSSLVAMHLACQAIRQGECDMALAGGVAVMSSTAPFIGFSELRGLAPDGRSKAFSANSDGMTLAEGVGVLLLERLADARRNGHQVLAVVRGTAVNQDGASNGLTAPNGPSQQRVIRQALANARLSPSDVDAVEAHGTGTTLGDPIEAQALLATYGQERPEGRPLWLGSIKSNIGHAQMAAGAAGVIKMVMAMRHEVLPASLHIDEPTPHVDWSAGDIHLLAEAREWPRGEHPRRAGISSFGISGTNAHVIVEQAPEEPPAAVGAGAGEPVEPVGGPVPWVVSARGAEALRGQARALAARVNADPGVSTDEVGWSLLRSRTLFDHRAVVIGQNREELVSGLEALAAGEPHPGVVEAGKAAEVTGQTAFLFSGQGSQRPGMGAELYNRFPIFAEAFDEVCALLDPHLEHPLRELVFSREPEQAALLDHTTYAQAGLFALHIALARLLDSLGVRPDTVIGHSIGEIAAAHIAGIFDLPDACHLVATRATLMGGLCEGGGMATIAATPDELAEDLARYDGQVGIAALNTPGNTVISGPTDLVTNISATWAAKGRKTRTLTVSHAFHSSLMDPILEPFKEAISGLTYHPPTIPLISNLTGQPADEHITTPDYWAQHIRQPVHFHPAVAHIAPETGIFLELGPDPTLTTATHHTLHHHTSTEQNPTNQPTPLITPALTRKQPERQALAHALARLHTAGVEIDWTSWFPADPVPRVVGLPTYAFQHQRFWLAPPAARTSFEGTAGDPAEARLWHAIEELDVDALSSTLRLEKDSPGIDALLPALPVLSTWRRQHRERSTIDSWRYQATWQQLPDPPTPTLMGTWLVVVPAGQEEHATVQVTVQALRAHGATALRHGVNAHDIDRAALHERLARLTEEFQPAGVISLLALDTEPLIGHSAVPAGLGATTALLQALDDAGIGTPLWCLTQGAVATGRGDLLPHPGQSQIWGFGRVAALEYPQRWGGLIDLPTTMTHHTAGRLAALLVPGQPEDQVAIRTTGTYARRLARVPAADTAPAPWEPSGTTLITGGTGGLGAQIARWLAHRGAPRLHLISRSGPDAPGASELGEELTALGTDITITACDASDRAALQRLIDTVPAEHPLTAVFHTAGTMELGQIGELDPGRLQSVLRSKALAAAHLHDLTQDLDLAAFVLFSSNAATWGSGQQAAYAAANTYLDALAEHRRARGLPATSLAWGPWGEAGMAADQHTLSHLKRRGLSPLPTDLAIASLHQALTHDDTAVTIADVDWETFGRTFTTQRPSPFLTRLLPTSAEPTTPAATADDNPLRQQLGAAPTAQRHQILVRHIQTLAATILGHPGLDAIPPGQPFQELGFDSLTAVELRNQLAASTGLSLAPALVFDHPTPNALATYLGAELTGQRATVATHTSSVATDDEPIAIVGMACRYPGGVRSPEELWKLVAAGRDAIGEMPTDRDWDLDTLFDPDPERLGTTYAREGGFLHNAAGFDAAFFGISPREALAMDPQQRLLLETAWETFESAGLDRDTLAGSNTGVFAGGTYQGYGASGSSSAREVEGYLLAGGTPSVMSGRVAYAFGLEGPAVTVDTACSSSLVAMHLAAQALRQGECTMALAGGVTVMATPTTFVEFSRQRGLAADGRCKPFASAADGTGWGEGAGLLLLERLSDARRNGHRVLAVIRGSAVNQDGTSNGLTAPNGPSQQRVIRQALTNARVSPTEVDVVEGHGTGTTLGDPIEAQALLATYGQERPEGRPLWLGSIKSNIGHTQAASGVAGVIKMVMAMRHEVLPASLHIDEPTPHVDWSAGDVQLLAEAREWPRGEHPRRAGISSFGISGTNAHVIVEQAPKEPPAVVGAGAGEPVELAERAESVEPVGGPVPWVVSARGAEALRGQARALAARVNADPGVSADEVGWSLLRSRTLFDHRAVVIGQNREELTAGLEALAAGEPHPGLVEPGEATDTTGKTVFLFSGQGSQRPGMGAELYDRFPIFAEAFDEVCALLDPHLEHPLRQVVFDTSPEHAGLLDHTTYAQAGLFALHIALARLLDSLGVRPDTVIGHSIGEIAAAHIAGIFDLPDACHLVATRATLMGGLREGGGMATIAATPDELAEDLAAHDGQVSIAALNTPTNTVISGPTELITNISATWAAKGRKTRTLTVSHAFHSPLMDPILEPFKEAISELTYHPPTIPLISNLTGQPADEHITTPDYWAQHIRQPVHFHPAITHTAPETGIFLELGPDPTLTTATHHTLHHHTSTEQNPTNQPTPLITSALTRKQPDGQALTHALARLHTAGVDIDWTSWYPATPTPRTIDLPTYAFQHQHYWLSSAPSSSPTPTEAALVDRKFWEAVEREDLEALAATIDSPADQQPMLSAVLPTLSAWRRHHREQSVINSWRYQIVWKRLSAPSTPPDLSGTWLLIIPAGQSDHPAVETVAHALTTHGATLIRHVLDTHTVDRDALADHLTRLAMQGEPTGVLSLLALDEEPHPEYAAVPSGLAATTVLLQALGDAEIPAPLWCLTQGAVATGPGDPLPSPRQAQTWGLGRAAALEHPRRWGGLIDLPAVIDHHTADRLAALLTPGRPEDQTAIRATGSYARRLRKATAPTAAPRTWQPTGTTLITGGTGGLGAHVARWLARLGAPHLHLISRSGPDAPGAAQLTQELADLGTAVTITACDASDRAALQRLLDTIPAEHPLTAVIHAAGTSDTELLADLGPERLEHVLGPKALAAAHLHELTQELDLSAFVLFSSGAAAWGGSRQGAYAAANTYLDALAEHRRARGLPATSLAWGPWGDAGMAADETALAFYGRRGLSPLSPELAVVSLQHALDHRDTTITVADIDWEKFPTAFTAQRPSPLLDDLITAIESPAEPITGASTGTSLQQRLSAGTPEQQHQLLLERIQSLAASILGHSGPDAIPPAQPFQELGFDSLTAVELRNQLATATGIDLAPALVFDHPTPNALATYLRAELTGQQTAVAAHSPTTAAQDEPIAIVGMACRYPGDAHSPQDLWELVIAHRDAIAQMPTDRNWDLDALYDPDPDRAGTSYVREGGFLRHAAEFDPAFFGISPREAIAMDPQQRLLLETAWETFESAGLDRDTLAGSNTGVFAGVTSQDYLSLTGDTASDVEGYVATGNIGSVVSGRVAYSFGLEGPAVTVDTACSSSLVAMHLAAQALRQGECTMALAGGVTVMATPGAFIEFSRQRGLAPDARCKPFAAAADGMVWGEGVGLVLLERLSDARRNGHRVLAVVRGSAVNQDGTSNGLTAPNGPSQQRVIRQALANARLSPSDVDAVEAHGTGTTLGDPIEAQALLATYGQERPEGHPLWLGSIKSNIGHTQAAAGVAGVIKMVMAMRHGVLPASLHIDEPSPNVDWNAGDLRLLAETVPWPQGDRPRRAGVSSFGISGTNAHLILEQAPEPAGPAPVSDVAGVVPWVVSAQSDAALRGQARALAGHIIGDPEASAGEVGWSLLRSRTLFDHRAVVIGQNREELTAGLEALAAGEPHPSLVEPGEATDITGKTVFLFSGQGSQRPGMGAELYDRFPIFAEAFDEVCALLDPHLEHPLRQVVFDTDPEHAGLLDHTTYAQAGLFALHIALARLLDSLGVRPDTVIGHSIGEIAAAHIAGIFDLPDACHLVATRATLMGQLPQGGAMATIAATPDELADDLAAHDGQVSIAALNTPGNTVISGPTDLVADISATWAAKGRKTRTLTVSHAFHSPLMDPILEPFKEAISDLTYHPPTIPLISNLTGQPADEHITTPDYWAQHIRQPVHFHPAITHTAPHTSTFLELGPDPTLTTATHHTLHHHTSTAQNPTNQPTPLITSTLTHKRPDTHALTHTLAQLHTSGTTIDWTSWYPATPTPRTIDLPTYAFQHQHYWLAPPAPRADSRLNGHNPAEARLWDAIEELDVDALASTLDLEKDSPGVDALLPALPVLSTWRRRHRERSTIDSWRYRVAWKQVRDLATAPTLSGTWLLLVPTGLEEHPAVHATVEALDAHGAAHEVLSIDGADARSDALAPLLSQLPDGSTPEGILSLLAFDQTPHPGHPAVPTGLAATAALVQALGEAPLIAPLWCVTQGAVATNAADPLPHPHQAQIWGMGRVAALEHPRLWAGLIDLPAVADARTPARIAAMLVPGQPEDQVAIRSTVLARRLERAACPDTAPTAWRPTGTTLITGGTGGLGAHVARWLARQGAPHLHLVSRSGPDAPGASQLAQELTDLGSAITIAACDVSDRAALQRLLDTIHAEHPLTTVIHAAGLPENTPIAELDLPGIDAVLRPKALAAALLHELTEELDLSAFVLFSSGAAAWGGGRQPSYAAANAYLDALAEHRRARGLAATSLAWAPWSDAGMASDEAAVDYYRRRGMRPLDTDLAIASLQHALDHGDTTITIADIDWERFPAGFTAQRPSPLLSDLAAAASPGPDAAPDATAAMSGSLQRQLATGTPAQRHQLLLHHIQTHAAAILGHPTIDAIPPAQPFQELGFDSLTAVEFGHRLSAATGVDLPPTLVFDHPTPKELADYLRERLVEGEPTSEGHLLSELDRWDSVSEPSAVDEAARRRITGRLRLLLSKWNGTERGAERSAAHSELETATAEDIFDLISDEFGKSDEFRKS
ncbi:hypothetical protein GCM10009548_94630 [Streptomyces malaysiensis subsp. malaysiensis]|uniref:SDR family NAD(P)-dependent oxidoreductase n=1 Tax=Streptomyces malaysiensis TaxID=92644 RepID=A0ABX6WFW3_STRMQ|nr:type I polyketide synthase [Streptomyces solisilvae]QPI60294.1 SDR family NAD(P)-dependent oxidoreductase [Streptomyces solisilvae]